jgi:hypothetical protein
MEAKRLAILRLFCDFGAYYLTTMFEQWNRSVPLGRIGGAVNSWGGYWELGALFHPPDHAVRWLVASPVVWKVGISIIRILSLCAAALFEDGKERQKLCLPLVFHQTLGFQSSYSFILLLYNPGVIY